MKANHPAYQPHRHYINDLIRAQPAERAEEKLQSISDQGNGDGQNDTEAGQGWLAGQAVEFLRQFQVGWMFNQRR